MQASLPTLKLSLAKKSPRLKVQVETAVAAVKDVEVLVVLVKDVEVKDVAAVEDVMAENAMGKVKINVMAENVEVRAIVVSEDVMADATVVVQVVVQSIPVQAMQAIPVREEVNVPTKDVAWAVV